MIPDCSFFVFYSSLSARVSEPFVYVHVRTIDLPPLLSFWQISLRSDHVTDNAVQRSLLFFLFFSPRLSAAFCGLFG